MDEKYRKNADLFKALADTNRLIILDMLSCCELCACKLLEKLNITQPTLSHHMKILCDCGLTSARKDSKWTYYSLNSAAIKDMRSFLNHIIEEDGDSAVEDACSCDDCNSK